MTHQQSRRAAYGSRRAEYKLYGSGEPFEMATPGRSGRFSASACERCGVPAQVQISARWRCLDCAIAALWGRLDGWTPESWRTARLVS
jgi:hypothetical protein